jgi:hypothetical protein
MSLILRRCLTTAQNKLKIDLDSKLLNSAINSKLILKSGWSSTTLLNSNQNVNLNSLQALFPSKPPTSSTTTTSRSRQQLIQDATSESTTTETNDHRQRSGPAQALFQHWLIYARQEMINYIELNNLSGPQAIKAGLKARIAFNHTHGKLDDLPDVSFFLFIATFEFLDSNQLDRNETK